MNKTSTAFSKSSPLDILFVDIKIFFVSLLYIQLLRWFFLISLGGMTGQPDNFIYCLKTSFYGVYYDIKLAFVLFFFLAVFSSLPSVFTFFSRLAVFSRWTILIGFVFFSSLFTGFSLEFFKEYNSAIDIRVFDGVNDDYAAILKTMISSYHLIEILVLVIAITLAYGFFFHGRFIRALKVPIFSIKFPILKKKIVLITIGVVFSVVSFLLSFGPLEVSTRYIQQFPSKIISASLIPGPISLYSAIYDYRLKLKVYSGKLHEKSDVLEALSRIFPDSAITDIDEGCVKISSGKFTLPDKPQHIFVLFMERYDSWPLLSAYDSLNTTNGLKSLIKKGIHFKNFLPGATTTMPSIQVALTGLPYIGIAAQHFVKTTYPGAIAKNMSSLGYKTRFFYGGSLKWQNIGQVSTSQGFDQVLGAGHIEDYLEKNEWGIDDQSLFKFISNVVKADPSPSFNLVLTSTNHPPYDLPLEKFEVPVDKIGKALDTLSFSNGSRRTNLNRMGHLWYSDRTMASFVKTMQKIFPTSLFAITGDHDSRAHIRLDIPLYERASVPLVLVGPDSLRQIAYDPQKPGSHLDIAPTLVELIAPKGVRYQSFGHCILDASHPGFAFGSDNLILTQTFITEENDPGSGQSFDGKPVIVPRKVNLDIEYIKSLKTVVWWRLLYGSQ